MPRTKCFRNIEGLPGSTFFKPAGIPLKQLEIITLELDEFEALRLADFEKAYQEEAAKLMKISRQTFGRIVAAARFKVADAIVNGKAIVIAKYE